MPIPTVMTMRLALRAPEAGDFAPYRDFYADSEASEFDEGPLTPALEWRKLAPLA